MKTNSIFDSRTKTLASVSALAAAAFLAVSAIACRTPASRSFRAEPHFWSRIRRTIF